jgi:predicted Zn-dependent protease
LNAEPVEPEAPWWTTLKGLPAMMKALAEARREVEHDTELVRAAKALIEQTDAFAVWKLASVTLDAAKDQVASLDAAVRKAALDDFTKNGEKAIYAGVSVKMYTKVDYDPKAMRDWAKVNMTSLLSLDRSATELAAKAGILDDAPVTVTKEPRAIIASDLSSYL